MKQRLLLQYNQKGFVILFAVLISAIILLIGAGVFSISLKETILSSSARESQFAINAADAGIECALLSDIITGSLVTGPINCNGGSMLIENNSFFLELDEVSQQGCALVTFEKQLITLQGGATVLETRIISRGFNVCDYSAGEPSYDDPLLVERVYRVRYNQAIATP